MFQCIMHNEVCLVQYMHNAYHIIFKHYALYTLYKYEMHRTVTQYNLMSVTKGGSYNYVSLCNALS